MSPTCRFASSTPTSSWTTRRKSWSGSAPQTVDQRAQLGKRLEESIAAAAIEILQEAKAQRELASILLLIRQLSHALVIDFVAPELHLRPDALEGRPGSALELWRQNAKGEEQRIVQHLPVAGE